MHESVSGDGDVRRDGESAAGCLMVWHCGTFWRGLTVPDRAQTPVRSPRRGASTNVDAGLSEARAAEERSSAAIWL